MHQEGARFRGSARWRYGGGAAVRPSVGFHFAPFASRFDKDVLLQTGVTHVVVMEGINDIGGARANPSPSADDLIAGHRQENLQELRPTTITLHADEHTRRMSDQWPRICWRSGERRRRISSFAMRRGPFRFVLSAPGGN